MTPRRTFALEKIRNRGLLRVISFVSRGRSPYFATSFLRSPSSVDRSPAGARQNLLLPLSREEKHAKATEAQVQPFRSDGRQDILAPTPCQLSRIHCITCTRLPTREYRIELTLFFLEPSVKAAMTTCQAVMSRGETALPHAHESAQGFRSSRTSKGGSAVHARRPSPFDA